MALGDKRKMNRIQPTTEEGTYLYVGIDPLQNHWWELWFATDPYLQEYGLPDLDDYEEEEDFCPICGCYIEEGCTCEEEGFIPA